MALVSDSQIWHKLSALAPNSRSEHLSELFENDPARAERMAIDLGDIFFDYSRQRMNAEVMSTLVDLATDQDVPGFFNRMVAGEPVNAVENRAALHTACRGTPCAYPAIHEHIEACDAQLKFFVEGILSGTITTSSGKPFRNVISVGVGGSELGPLLTLDALSDRLPQLLTVGVCGNVDGTAYDRAFSNLDMAETLIIVTSKSFTTLETAMNATRAKAEMQEVIGAEWASHFVAITANAAAAQEFGIANDRVFPIWDWVGGRYSIWSAVGLPMALAFGWDAFAELREGAREMDQHALTAPVAENVPILMALFTIWNTNFLNARAEACVPYDTRMQLFSDYLKQLEMESNGKRVTTAGVEVPYRTQPIVFGGIGSDAQHAFFQQLHQGTDLVALDFLVFATPVGNGQNMHNVLTANAIAQADAMAFGRSDRSNMHRYASGNQPSSILIYKDLDARMLGKLIALYEHKTVAAACILGINPFDQWGVQLGKDLTGDLEPVFAGGAPAPERLQRFVAAFNRMRGGIE